MECIILICQIKDNLTNIKNNKALINFITILESLKKKFFFYFFIFEFKKNYKNKKKNFLKYKNKKKKKIFYNLINLKNFSILPLNLKFKYENA